MTPLIRRDRRQFLKTGAAALPLVLLNPVSLLASEEKTISPTEDLMREHGILNRLLLVYEEIERRISKGQDFPPEALAGSAAIMSEFIENYHEQLEEDEIFPRFEKAGKRTDLVQTLREQHYSGRMLTHVLRQYQAEKRENRDQAAEAIRQFIRMYRPHEAWEDTVLFPEFRALLSEKEFSSLGENFERREEELFGKNGFAKMTEKVAGIESSLGMADLAGFTPGMAAGRKGL